MELLIVVALMGILAVIGMDSYFFSQKKARDAARKSDLSNIAKAIELFNHDTGGYPLGSSGDIIGCESGSGYEACVWDGRTAFRASTTTYMAKLPRDPLSQYRYYYESDGMTYGLYAELENDQDPSYHSSGLVGTDCGANPTGVLCNYYLSQNGVEMP